MFQGSNTYSPCVWMSRVQCFSDKWAIFIGGETPKERYPSESWWALYSYNPYRTIEDVFQAGEENMWKQHHLNVKNGKKETQHNIYGEKMLCGKVGKVGKILNLLLDLQQTLLFIFVLFCWLANPKSKQVNRHGTAQKKVTARNFHHVGLKSWQLHIANVSLKFN